MFEKKMQSQQCGNIFGYSQEKANKEKNKKYFVSKSLDLLPQQKDCKIIVCVYTYIYIYIYIYTHMYKLPQLTLLIRYFI